MIFDAAVQSMEAVRGVDLELVQRGGERKALRALYKQEPAAAPNRGRVFIRKALAIQPRPGDQVVIGSELLAVTEVTENTVQWIAAVRLSRVQA